MPDPQPTFETPENSEKRKVFINYVTEIVLKVFVDAKSRLEEIEKQAVGQEDFKSAQNAVSGMLRLRITTLEDSAREYGWPEDWIRIARTLISALLDGESESFFNRIDQYTDPERNVTYGINALLGNIEHEETRRIIYLVLLNQDPALFSNDPEKVIKPTIAQLLSRIDQSYIPQSSQKFLRSPEEVIEQLLTRPIT